MPRTKVIPNIFQKFKHALRFKFLKENFKLELRNNDRIYYQDINDFHSQETDVGTGDRLSRIGEGTAHKTGQLWGTTFRFYNFLKYFKKSDLTVVDIGCDDAFLRKAIHSGTYFSGTNYIGVEFKLKSVRKASDAMPKCGNPATFVCADLYQGLPFLRKESVDIVICMEVIEHLEEKAGENLMREIKRVLKPGGIAFMSQPNHSPDFWYVWRKYRKTGGYPQHLRERTPVEFRKLCNKIGLKIVDMYGNLCQRTRLKKELKNEESGNDVYTNEQMSVIYERLVEIMGPEIPTQVIGQLYLNASGGMVHVLQK
jgi:SAM-dependent methyltransferase